MRQRSVLTAVGGAAVAAGAAGAELLRRRARQGQRLERLLPQTPTHATAKQVLKPTPDSLFADKGTGTDFETRLSTLDGYLTPTDRFYVRSHSPTPDIDVSTWVLRVDGDGVRHPVDLTYEVLREMPQVRVTRALECAGNGRRFFKDTFGVEAEGGQWRIGAMGVAEWGGVRLSEVLAKAGVTEDAVEVMPHGLDDHHVARPMPVAKAMAEDTVLALDMNGEPLLPDHGYPARVIVPGWAGVASIKWVGRIEVSTRELHTPYNTVEYVLVGPGYKTGDPAIGEPITEMPVFSALDLDWPGQVDAGANVVWGRAQAGEGKVRSVAYRIDDGPWREAELVPPNIEGAWVRFRFDWEAPAGRHAISTRATDDRGRTQPDSVRWNHHGYLYNAVVGHPVTAR